MHFKPVYLIVIPLVFLLSCDESLPPRRDPSNLFDLTVWPYYNYTPSANDVVIHMNMVNNFDETLSSNAGVEGSFVVTSARDTSIHKTIQVGLANFIHANYNAVRGILTVDPGDSVVLEATWGFTDDSAHDLTNGFFNYRTDPTCQQRLVADPESFSVVGRLKLFKNLGYAATQTTITFRQYNVFVGPHDCTPL